MADQIQVRRDTAATWTSVDPILADGEMGYETDTFNVKFGDGSTAWSSLAYFTTGVPGGQVDSVVGGTDVSVDVSDPVNPIVNFTGSTGGQVDSVVGGTDVSVDSSDPVNPIVNFTGSAGGQVDSVVGGTDITVDVSDPVNPIVNYTGSGGGGGGGQVDTVVAGDNVTIDSSDPVNPIVTGRSPYPEATNYTVGPTGDFATWNEMCAYMNGHPQARPFVPGNQGIIEVDFEAAYSETMGSTSQIAALRNLQYQLKLDFGATSDPFNGNRLRFEIEDCYRVTIYDLPVPDGYNSSIRFLRTSGIISAVSAVGVNSILDIIVDGAGANLGVYDSDDGAIRATNAFGGAEMSLGKSGVQSALIAGFGSMMRGKFSFIDNGGGLVAVRVVQGGVFAADFMTVRNATTGVQLKNGGQLWTDGNPGFNNSGLTTVVNVAPNTLGTDGSIWHSGVQEP